jgi:hypothetical protein
MEGPCCWCFCPCFLLGLRGKLGSPRGSGEQASGGKTKGALLLGVSNMIIKRKYWGGWGRVLISGG